MTYFTPVNSIALTNLTTGLCASSAFGSTFGLMGLKSQTGICCASSGMEGGGNGNGNDKKIDLGSKPRTEKVTKGSGVFSEPPVGKEVTFYDQSKPALASVSVSQVERLGKMAMEEIQMGTSAVPFLKTFSLIKEVNPDPAVQEVAQREHECCVAVVQRLRKEAVSRNLDYSPEILFQHLEKAISSESPDLIEEYGLRLMKALFSRDDGADAIGSLVSHDNTYVRLAALKGLLGYLKECIPEMWIETHDLTFHDVKSSVVYEWAPAIEILYVFSHASIKEARSELEKIAESDMNAEKREYAKHFLDKLH